MKIHVFYAVVILVVSMIATTGFSNHHYTVTEVTPGVFYHQGLHQEPSEDNIGAIANVSFIIGDRCVAVIDSGGSYTEGIRLRQAIYRQTDLPVCYVINTHAHPDHMFGNAAFKKDNPEYIGHANMPMAMTARQSFFGRTFQEILGQAYQGTEFIAPTRLIYIDAPVTIDLGKRLITLTAYPTSHTDNDLTVFDDTTRTLWTGDLLFMERIPVLDGNINGWINTMRQLQAMNINTVVPGHGPASNDKWQRGLAEQLRYFSLLRDEIRAVINNFGTINQATQQVGLKEEKQWELFDSYHSRNVTAAFVQLEWE